MYQNVTVCLFLGFLSHYNFTILQEFHLTQTYHEGLLKLQSKDYGKAQELLESVLKDPLISTAQVILLFRGNFHVIVFVV